MVHHRITVDAVDAHNVRGGGQAGVRGMTGIVTLDGVIHAYHLRAALVGDGVLETKVETRLAAKWQRKTVSEAALDGALHPHHAPCSSIGLQSRKGRNVGAAAAGCASPGGADGGVVQ